MLVDNSLECGVSECIMWHSRQSSENTSPHVSLLTKGDDSAKIVSSQCCSDGHIFGLIVPLPPAVSIGFTEEANISLQEAVGQNFFLSAMCVLFHTVPKHLDSSSTFHKADVTSRALSSHFVSRF